MSAFEPVQTVSSPMELLHAEHSAQEVLVLTYTTNLEFFERWALGASRALGARATVIADARMVTTDPLSVRSAGVRYLDARAICPGYKAFHPKLLVIADKGRCTIAIGSGNLTLAGWHGNEELWSVVRAEDGTGPQTISQVARFLRQLCDGRIHLSYGAAAAVDRVVELLDTIESTEPGPRLLSSLEGPIIAGLPLGPVDELNIYSPFFDPSLEALSRIHDRLSPATTNVFVQSATSVKGDLLETWLEDHGGQLIWCEDAPYRHGKLIEWMVGGQRSALTGSPNLSTAALLRYVADQGVSASNCELGTIWTVSETLAPRAVDPPDGGVGRLSFSAEPGDLEPVGLVLLSAVLGPASEIVVSLAKPLAATARLQTFAADIDWVSIPNVAPLVPGESRYSFAVVLDAGTALRLLSDEGASNEVYLLDPARVRQRPWNHKGPSPAPPDEIVLTGGLADLFEIADLLRVGLVEMGVLRSQPGGAEESVATSEEQGEKDTLVPVDGATLADYRAACAAVFGDYTVDWVLTLPRLPGLGTIGAPAAEGLFLTSDATDDSADAGRETGEQTNETVASVLRSASERQRGRVRHFCGRILEVAAIWPNFMRAYAAKLTLHAVAAELWDWEEEDGILSSLVEVLTAPGDEPTNVERSALAGYLTVTNVLLLESVDKLSVRDEATLRYEEAVAASSTLIGFADPEQLELLAIEFADVLGGASGQWLLDRATEIASPPDQVERTLELLSIEYEVEASAADEIITVHSPLAMLYERDLMRIARVCGPGVVAVRGVCTDGIMVGCVWDESKRLLLIVRATKHGTRGRIYEGPSAEPALIADGWDPAGSVQDNMPRPSLEWMAGQPMPDVAMELLELRPVLRTQ